MIRSFIYLDSEKLRSFSSQIFEGVTEQIVASESTSKAKEDRQKGPLNSGLVLADIFSREQSSAELKFLEDHAYSIFENKLTEIDKLINVVEHEHSPLANTFVKVDAPFQLDDMDATAKLLADFNTFGEAFWRVSNESMVAQPNGPKILSDNDARKRAAESSLQLNDKVAKAAATIMKFGLNDVLEATMQIGDRVFSAPLKRKFLRESEDMLVRKYSRVSSLKFTMVGVATTLSVSSSSNILPDVKDSGNFKGAMRTLTLHMRELENTFTSGSENEVIVDPVAIYTEL